MAFSKVEGNYKSNFKRVKLYLHGFQNLSGIKVNNKSQKLISEDYVVVLPVSSFDPFIKKVSSDMVNPKVPCAIFENNANEIKISW